jgi:hypothetical protein
MQPWLIELVRSSLTIYNDGAFTDSYGDVRPQNAKDTVEPSFKVLAKTAQKH